MKKKSKSNKKDKKVNNLIYLILRYLILLSLMFSLPLIYKIFTPLTTNLVSYILDIFYDVFVSGNLIMVNSAIYIQIVSACVAGSAYLLLLILNLSVEMNYKKRIYSILTSFLILFTLNVLRIVILSIFLVNNYSFFDFTHKLFWYVLSTLFVVIIWFFVVYLFSIKSIPIYSDFKYIYRNSSLKK